MIYNEEKSIIIAGNGPSLAHIDYRRLPENAKILRLNNFFFEDKYYLGQNVDYYLTDAGYLEGMYFNLHNLNESRQYNIKDVYITNLSANLQEEFPLVYDAMATVFQNKKIKAFFKFYLKYYEIMPSGGIFSIFLAIVLGYKNIYVIGIDMYENNLLYPWQIGEYFTQLHPRDKADNVMNVINRYHPKEFQIKTLEFIKQEFQDINLYSLSEESPITEYLELAPIQDENNNYTPQIRSQDAIKDWLPLPLSKIAPITEAVKEPEPISKAEPIILQEKKSIGILQQIFSVKNEDTHKVVRLCGIKLKFNRRI